MILIAMGVLAVIIWAFVRETRDPDKIKLRHEPPCVCDHSDEKIDCDNECLNKPNLDNWPPCRCMRDLDKCDFNCHYPYEDL